MIVGLQRQPSLTAKIPRGQEPSARRNRRARRQAARGIVAADKLGLAILPKELELARRRLIHHGTPEAAMQRWQIGKLFDERINYLGKGGMSLQLQ